MEIYTIGSNGKKLPEFIEILKKNGIETVLDIRKSAKSQHVPKFSGKNLSVELPKNGIKYIHKEELGVPFEIIQRYTDPKSKEPLTDTEFEDYYRKRIEIDELGKEIKESGKTVLLCACEYAVSQGKQKHNCHRSILANMLKETGEFDEIIRL